MPVPRQRAPHRCRAQRQLGALAEVVDQSMNALGPDDPPHLVRVTGPGSRPSGGEVALLPLPGIRHPADILLGFTAPPEWAAVGVISTAHQQATDEPRRPAEPARMTFLLHRSGCSVTLLTPLEPAGAEPAGRRLLTAAPEGPLADICRRVLGLPTAPPDQHPVEWVTRRWLDHLLAEAVAHPGRPGTWAEAVGLHPLVDHPAVPSPTALAELSSATMGDFGWERLRRLAAEGVDRPEPLIEPELAAWMDVGCFARWLLAAELPEPLLLDELRALLPSVVMQAIVSALVRPPGQPPAQPP